MCKIGSLYKNMFLQRSFNYRDLEIFWNRQLFEVLRFSTSPTEASNELNRVDGIYWNLLFNIHNVALRKVTYPWCKVMGIQSDLF